MAQFPPVHLPGVYPIQQDLTAVRVIEPHQQIDKGGLSAAGRANNGDPLSRLNRQVEVSNQRFFRHIGEGKIPDLHPAPHRIRALGMLRLRGLGRGIQQIKYPLGTGNGILQLRHHAGNFIEGLGILIGIVQEHRQATHRNPAGNRNQSTAEAHTGIDHRVDKPGAGIGQ